MNATIVAASDARYFTYLDVFLSSLCAFNADGIPLTIVDLGLTPEQRARVERVRFLAGIVSVDAAFDDWIDRAVPRATFDAIADILPPRVLAKRMNWLKKLFIHTIRDDDRLIWIDADIIVGGELRLDEFFQDAADNPIVVTRGKKFRLRQHAQPEAFADVIHRDVLAGCDLEFLPSPNFNSGVFAVEPAFLKDLVEGPITELMRRYPREIIAGGGGGNIPGDQSLLNLAVAMTGHKTAMLPASMNVRWVPGTSMAFKRHHGRDLPFVFDADGEPVKLLHYPGTKPDSPKSMGDHEPVRTLFQAWREARGDWSAPFGRPRDTLSGD